MASSDWTFLTGSLSSGNCAFGVTSGTSKPNGGGSFVYGMNSLTNTVGIVGLYTNQTNFAPTAKGTDVSMAMVRATSGGLTSYSSFVFAGLGGNATTDLGYLLGLSDGDPCHIELRKGALSSGLPDEAPGGTNVILAQSSITIPVNTWMHLRLEHVVQPNGDVYLNTYMSDLTANLVTAPTWTAIPGMATVIDDALGVNTGSLPYTSGYAGFAARFADVSRRCFFDQAVILRQL